MITPWHGHWLRRLPAVVWAGVACVLVLFVNVVRAGDDDLSRLRQSVNELVPIMLDAARHGPSPDLSEKLAEKRREVIEYTRRHLPNRMLERKWSTTVHGLYGWALRYEFHTYETSEAATRELFETLQTATPGNKAVAATALSEVMRTFGHRWIQTPHAPACLRLLDEIETWIMADPAQPQPWQLATSVLQAHGILYAGFFPVEERERIRNTREEKLRRWMSESHLHFHLKTLTVSQWANALYLNGDGDRSHDVLMAWWRRHGERIKEPIFFNILMKVLIYDKADWDQAGKLLEYLNSISDTFKQPSRKATYEQTTHYYYGGIALPEYEIRRLRQLQITEWRDGIAEKMGVEEPE